MTFAITVDGGTGAGRKRPLKQAPKRWTHDCPGIYHHGDATQRLPLSLPGWLPRCWDCGACRP